MIEALLMGLIAGSRSMTPLATVAWLARARELPNEGPLGRFLSRGRVVTGATALAVGEALGDKMRSAPARTVIPGLAGRIATASIAGAALVRQRDQIPSALVGAAAAVGSSYITLAVRRRLMEHFGQRSTGALEDAVVLAGVLWIASRVRQATLAP